MQTHPGNGLICMMGLSMVAVPFDVKNGYLAISSITRKVEIYP